jgi:hypothetical protein
VMSASGPKRTSLVASKVDARELARYGRTTSDRAQISKMANSTV